MREGEAKAEEGACWNLGALYESPDDPAIGRDEVEVDRLIEAFQAHRSGLRRRNLGPRKAKRVVRELEAIRFLSDKLVTYAGLGAAADQEDPRFAALYARLEERHRRWNAQTVFAELAFRRLPPETLEQLIAHPSLLPYKHFLAYQAALAPHTLSEAEEQVALKKNIAGRDAQVRFREQFAARQDFGSLRVNGADQPMTAAKLIALQEHADPDLRFQARTRLNETFGHSREIFSFLYGSVVKDHGVEAEIRGYESPIDVENVPNEIPGVVVRNLLDLGRKYLPTVHEYYRWKAERLGVPRLRTCDLMAPIPGADPAPIPWADARRAVEKAFARLDPSYVRIIRAFFTEERLDTEVRKAKRGGAFCAPVPGLRPFILMSYTGTLSTLITLAHELGHGIHFVHSNKEQSYLQAYGMSKVIAETASEFAECLLKDHLLETSKDPALRLKVQVNEVERLIGVIFRQLFYTEFETAVHERAAREPLSADTLSTIWTDLARDHYGPDVDLLEADAAGWTIVGHFVFNPFYCYSYALSQVVVLTLYSAWQREGDAFLPKFARILKAGWSGTPQQILGEAGIDLTAPGVLEAAFREFAERVRQVRETVR